jgi:HEPN domain-containing protein
MSNPVEEFSKQWLIKAQEDWDTVEILTAQDEPPAGVVCFHCQQCIEKLIKAVLTRHSIEFPRTHDIERLIKLTGDLLPDIQELTSVAHKLTVHGVETRYPGESKLVSHEEMKEIVNIADKVRQAILSSI